MNADANQINIFMLIMGLPVAMVTGAISHPGPGRYSE
jgi:hypothetical protein